MAIRVEVWGDYALFSRPEMKTERVSYDVMTPSAARGIIEAIYWHPGLKWIIDKIYVLSPIRFTNIRRNEVKAKASARAAKQAMTKKNVDLYLSTKEEIQQRASMVLCKVHYVIEAHVELTDKANASDNAGKFQDIISRSLKRGQCYHTPYFGCREFPVNFREYEFDSVPTAYAGEDKELGYMLYDMDYSDLQHIRPMFFKATLHNGVLDLRDCEVHS